MLACLASTTALEVFQVFIIQELLQSIMLRRLRGRRP